MNKLPFADLHVHSFMSDGTMSPKDILKKAEENGIGLLAIADHDMFDGSVELCKIGEESEVKCVPAAEITCTENGRQVHVLCYRPNLKNAAFLSFVAEGRKKLDMMSVRLIEKMKEAGYRVSREEFEKFEYDRTGGGWKALHYFLEIGVTQNLKDGFSLYDSFGCGYETAGFPSVKTAIDNIHSAEGIAVIAHPGVSLDANDSRCFVSQLERFVSFGADGVECFYPEHSAAISDICERFCDERGLLKTSGSDFHGSFTSRAFGVPRKKTEELRLNGII